jgi:hypothetical protein
MTRSKLLYEVLEDGGASRMLQNAHVLIDAKNATLSAVGQVYTDCHCTA